MNAHYKTTATVHSYHEGDIIVNATLPNGEERQATVQGVTVELIDHNGTAHTHRFINVDKARGVFGAGAGTKVACVYELEEHGPLGEWTPQHATAAADATAEPGAVRPEDPESQAAAVEAAELENQG